MHVNGGCHCGFITFEAEADPNSVRICHCTDCQTLSGSAYRVTVPARAESFRLLTGSPTIYVKTADSGNKRAHTFCPRCGTPIYAAAVTNPEVYGIRVGTLRQRAQLPPRLQIWCRSALDSAMNLEALAHIATQPT
jgi:hypothetical protein